LAMVRTVAAEMMVGLAIWAEVVTLAMAVEAMATGMMATGMMAGEAAAMAVVAKVETMEVGAMAKAVRAVPVVVHQAVVEGTMVAADSTEVAVAPENTPQALRA